MSFKLGDLVIINNESRQNKIVNALAVVKAIDHTDDDCTYCLQIHKSFWKSSPISEDAYAFDFLGEWGEQVQAGEISHEEETSTCHIWLGGYEIDLIRKKSNKLSRRMFPNMIEYNGWLYNKDHFYKIKELYEYIFYRPMPYKIR